MFRFEGNEQLLTATVIETKGRLRNRNTKRNFKQKNTKGVKNNNNSI
jgi:hypothetical protein